MKHLINYELSSFHKYMNEGTMSDIHLLAKEVKNEKEFISKFFKEYGDKVKQDKQSEEWVKSLYSDMNESVVTEASRWKGKEIFPTYVKPNDISGLIKKELLKLISSFGIGEIIYLGIRWPSLYYLLEIGIEPYLASIISEIIATTCYMISVTVFLRKTKTF